MIKEIRQNTLLKDIMLSPVITIKETDDFHVVQDKFTTYDIRHLPVVDDAGHVKGLVSQRHLYKLHSPRKLEDGNWFYDNEILDSFILKNVMMTDPFMLKGDNTLEEAMQAMSQFKFGCIIIADNLRRPIGIITRDTIIKFFLNHA